MNKKYKVFENTKNNNIEKKMADFVLNDVFKRYSDVIINLFKFSPEDHNFYLNIITSSDGYIIYIIKIINIIILSIDGKYINLILKLSESLVMLWFVTM